MSTADAPSPSGKPGSDADPSSPGPPGVERIIDANLNRSAEALRVLEDLCRFQWSLGGLASDFKDLRHALLGLCSPDAASRARLIASRDIHGDAGASTPSPSEPSGESAGGLTDLGIRNLERLKESLRTLEETSRLSSKETALSLQDLRYRTYALEKGLVGLLGSPRDERLSRARLCFLWTPSLACGPALEILEGALEGGVDLVQVRIKDAPDPEILEHARRARELTLRAAALLVVNDRPDLARLACADGVHLGQDDLPPAEARRIVGDGALVGLSTHSLEQARAGQLESIDYVGVGPAFPTSTKDAGPPLGTDNCARIFSELSLPGFAIGGIDADTQKSLVASGVDRIAVSSAILTARSREEARARSSLLKQALPGT